jgi:hypothetical protein
MAWMISPRVKRWQRRLVRLERHLEVDLVCLGQFEPPSAAFLAGLVGGPAGSSVRRAFATKRCGPQESSASPSVDGGGRKRHEETLGDEEEELALVRVEAVEGDRGVGEVGRHDGVVVGHLAVGEDALAGLGERQHRGASPRRGRGGGRRPSRGGR